eukprot:TRINITY_DN8206_c0_g1_i2.p1 TRINITY_DN8206_c0_g1~~TRINITY_DN8206_c0_g1_i2.p1  ORF type:complete len:496 (-),score=156.54 TRINITY_DN8206_c0_g1_i2:32-1519(-)
MEIPQVVYPVHLTYGFLPLPNPLGISGIKEMMKTWIQQIVWAKFVHPGVFVYPLNFGESLGYDAVIQELYRIVDEKKLILEHKNFENLYEEYGRLVKDVRSIDVEEQTVRPKRSTIISKTANLAVKVISIVFRLNEKSLVYLGKAALNSFRLCIKAYAHPKEVFTIVTNEKAILLLREYVQKHQDQDEDDTLLIDDSEDILNLLESLYNEFKTIPKESLSFPVEAEIPDQDNEVSPQKPNKKRKLKFPKKKKKEKDTQDIPTATHKKITTPPTKTVTTTPQAPEPLQTHDILPQSPQTSSQVQTSPSQTSPTPQTPQTFSQVTPEKIITSPLKSPSPIQPSTSLKVAPHPKPLPSPKPIPTSQIIFPPHVQLISGTVLKHQIAGVNDFWYLKFSASHQGFYIGPITKYMSLTIGSITIKNIGKEHLVLSSWLVSNGVIQKIGSTYPLKPAQSQKFQFCKEWIISVSHTNLEILQFNTQGEKYEAQEDYLAMASKY